MLIKDATIKDTDAIYNIIKKKLKEVNSNDYS